MEGIGLSKEFFSLIYGDRVVAAPGVKVIPSAEFSTLQSAEGVLQRIQEDASKYRLEVTKECEEIKRIAHSEGYEEGYSLWAEKLIAFESQIEEVKAEMQKAIVPVALMAAKKIVGREIELSEDVIVDIVMSCLQPVAQHKKVTIYVNKKDFEILEKNKQKLKEAFDSLEALSIRPRDDIAPLGCVIETEMGIVNAQEEHRWNVLKEALERLAMTKSKKKETKG